MLVLHLILLFTPPLFGDGPAPFRIEQLIDENGRPEASGYIVHLSRPAAEGLASILDEFVDEEAIADAISAERKDLTTRMFILFAKQRYKKLKLDLREQVGTEGVTITVKGIRPLDLVMKDRTEEDREDARRRERLIQALLPRKLKAAHSMINTVPTSWEVKPRGELLKPVPQDPL